MHILLIEPDRILREQYEKALAEAGHTVDHAATAQAAVRAADAAVPDVVVLAMDMARHNGVEFLYEFKSYAEWQAVPVVLLVARLNHELAGHDQLRNQLGVAAVLVKSELTLAALCSAVLEARKDTA